MSFALLCAGGIPWAARHMAAQPASGPAELEASFDRQVRPFFTQHCVRCHNADAAASGVRVDDLDGRLEDRKLRLWEAVRSKISSGTMPPKGMPQPGAGERRAAVEWITRGLEYARLRPAPKNGMVRRLTVAQYRNTLRELLLLDDEVTEKLPPDAVSRDGFVNNKETLQLSPLLMEAYLEIAEDALGRVIVDPKSKPSIQNFRVDLGESVNPNPIPDKLILGADSLLLENKDFLVTQLTPVKPFPYDPFFMRTKYRFIEGYEGNDTVRGWREYDSIYHAVFACMRGSHGYPKGHAYSAVPGGLALRPAIPSNELFGIDSTYGPKANFKISLRELPDHGRFRVTVTASKYDDGLLLDPGARVAAGGGIEIRGLDRARQVSLAKAGIYQVDIYPAPQVDPNVAPDPTRLSDGLAGAWPLDTESGIRLEGAAKLADSPFGKAASFESEDAAVAAPRTGAMDVGVGDFTVAAWIHPKQLRGAGIAGRGAYHWTHGWYLDMPDNKGTLRLETAGPDSRSNGTVTSPQGVIVAGAWQHVAAVVRRGGKQTRLYVNGYLVAKGQIGAANLDNPKMDFQIGRIPGARPFRGLVDEVRFYRRALDEAELQALLEPGRTFVRRPPERPLDVKIAFGSRYFSGTLEQPAFLAVRLPAGELPVRAEYAGARGLERIVLTPLDERSETARQFLAFEKRSPRLGVHAGLRRDCGSTLFPVGPPRAVSTLTPAKFVFEGAIRNFPSPDVEKDNVNYLAGIREIGVRSEYTDGRDMPRLLIRSVEFEGPFYESWPPAAHRNIFIESARKNDPDAYAREILRRFATRAYRRPATEQEESALLAVFRKSYAASGNFQQAVKDALAVALTSPQFLFLVEKSATPEAEPLDDYELASKLSYFLWNGPPDREALKLAAAGALRARLDSETDRMIADPRFSRFVQEFVAQWLSLDKFSVLDPDLKRFPKLTRDTRAQLRQEPAEFVQHLIRNNLPLRNLIRSDFVVANEVVADYYGLGAKIESGFQFIPVRHGRRELGGVLTAAAILAGLSDGRESNPVKRGAWVARKIVAEPPDDPPPNVPALKEDPAQQLTLRQRIERHRSQPGCQQCHTKIDPWGIALEEFDAGGRLKTEAADARSTLPDKTEVAGIEDFKRYLAEDRIGQVAFSFLKHLATYASGRSLTYNELDYLRREGAALRAGEYRMKEMVRFVVKSRIFLEK